MLILKNKYFLKDEVPNINMAVYLKKYSMIILLLWWLMCSTLKIACHYNKLTLNLNQWGLKLVPNSKL